MYGMCIIYLASVLPQDWINVIQDCSYINFPSPIRESFLWVMVGCRAVMNCINLNLTISGLNWIRKTSLISRISLKFYLFWIGNKAEKNYEEKWVFHWFLYHSGTENCFYSSTFCYLSQMQIYQISGKRKWEEKCHWHSLVQPVCLMSLEAIAVTGLPLFMFPHYWNSWRKHKTAGYTLEGIFKLFLSIRENNGF